MSSEITKLDDTEVQRRLKAFPNWVLSNGELRREFSLPSFPSAIFFVNAIAHLAEIGAHHPDIQIAYSKVSLHFTTHSAGGITEKDFVMAQKIDELWHTFDWTSNI
ncbi:MAG: 4a-hydroxytetrahydrobiopterin dehydratase [Ktedonobacteraceae bacterium]